MATACAVARHFILLAENEDEPEYLTHLRVQKLLYYAQAWSLVQRGVPLFSERIEAWVNGPVVRDLFPRLAALGRRAITSSDLEACGVDDLTPSESEFVGSVWEAYKGHSAWGLGQMTHEEAPWRDARAGFEPLDRCDAEITQEAMRAYFSAP
jgi:uncharacterized phage-associated protein